VSPREMKLGRPRPLLRMKLQFRNEATRGSQTHSNITSKSVLRLFSRSDRGMVWCVNWNCRALQGRAAEAPYSGAPSLSTISRRYDLGKGMAWLQGARRQVDWAGRKARNPESHCPSRLAMASTSGFEPEEIFRTTTYRGYRLKPSIFERLLFSIAAVRSGSIERLVSAKADTRHSSIWSGSRFAAILLN